MIIPGICSVTLNDCSIEEVIQVTKDSGLKAIEWGGKIHVPPTEESNAQKVSRLMAENGLLTSSYGSYYRLGVSEEDGMSFESVLRTASILGAPTIRVWAGSKDREDASEEEIHAVLEDAGRIAAMAAAKGISITFEFHGGTLTNSAKNARQLADELPHKNIYFSWQQPHGFTLDECLQGLDDLLPRLSTVHVYYWTIGSWDRNTKSDAVDSLIWPDDYFMHPLADGAERWTRYIEKINQSDEDHFALLEFVKEGTIDQVKEDAASLLQLVS